MPRSVEVLNINSIVARGILATPQEETLLTVLRDGEAENDGPNKAENETGRSILDIRGTNIDELELLILEVVEDEVAVLQLVNIHLTFY